MAFAVCSVTVKLVSFTFTNSSIEGRSYHNIGITFFFLLSQEPSFFIYRKCVDFLWHVLYFGASRQEKKGYLNTSPIVSLLTRMDKAIGRSVVYTVWIHWTKRCYMFQWDMAVLFRISSCCSTLLISRIFCLTTYQLFKYKMPKTCMFLVNSYKIM